MNSLGRIAALSLAAVLVACGSSGNDGGSGAQQNCTPVNACHEGMRDSSGACVDLNVAVADGTACGTQMVCSAGTCVAACVAGQPCGAANPCKVGVTTCPSASAAPVCTDTGNLPDGTGCGSGNVCSAGSCVAPTCVAGQDCQPENVCTNGVTTCQTPLSVPGCRVTDNKPDGTGCGTGNVCSGGSCMPVACTPGAACDPADPCDVGQTVCTSPTAPGTCSTSGTKPDGTPCGFGLICSAGTCSAACVADRPCDLADPCAVGVTACSSPWATPTCNAAGTKANGTTCGTDKVCSAGACIAACVGGGACQPTNPCATGTTACASSWATATCNVTGNQPNGTTCGAGLVCSAGACVAADTTRPTVELRTPAPGATNVWSRDPITVRFSEKIAPASIDGQSVVLAAAGGITVPITTSLGVDGRTLTITPASLPGPATRLTATLSSRITDLAGNALVLPSDVWSWELPAWLYLGVGLSARHACSHSNTIAVDDLGQPTLGYVYTFTNSCETGDLFFEVGGTRWADGAWAQSTTIPIGADHGSPPLTVVDSAGRATIVWREGSFARAATWLGTQWSLYPPLRWAESGRVTSAWAAVNARAHDDRLVVAWVESVDAWSQLYARRWNGQEWEPLYGSSGLRDPIAALDPATLEQFGEVQISFDATGEPVFYWERFRADRLYISIDMASRSSSARCDDVATSSFREFAWRAPSSGTCPVHLAYAIPTGTWTAQVYARPANAASAVGPLNVLPTASGVSIGVDAGNAPIVAWFEKDDQTARGYARRWLSPVWQDLGTFEPPEWDVGGLDMAVGPAGVAVATLDSYSTGFHEERYVFRSNNYAPPAPNPIALTSILINDAQGARTTIPNTTTFRVAYTPTNATHQTLTWSVCANQPVACSPDPTGHCRTCTPSTTNGTITSSGVYTPPMVVPASPTRVYLTACQVEQAICDWSYVDVYR